MTAVFFFFYDDTLYTVPSCTKDELMQQFGLVFVFPFTVRKVDSRTVL